MRRTLTRVLSVGMVAVLAVVGSVTSAPAAAAGTSLEVVIDFEDVDAPELFANAQPLRDEYADRGVRFVGPGPDDGGAVVHEDGNWDVTGYSPTNFVGFSEVGTLANGGTPIGPQTMLFDPAIDTLSLYAAAGFGSSGDVTLQAYDAQDVLVDSDTRAVAKTGVHPSVSGSGIVRVVLSFTTGDLVVDDLTFTQVPPPSGCSDVPRGVFYTVPFDWAWFTGVTTGVGGTDRCEPLRPVSRAEAITILWRSLGSPVVATPHGFVDTTPGAFYQAALRWAADEGITTGVGGSAGNPSPFFDPDGLADRAQQFTLVWRVVGEPGGAPHPFVDVATGSFYEKAVNWAAANGVTTGYGGTNRFEPHIVVDRAQMFTISYRTFT